MELMRKNKVAEYESLKRFFKARPAMLVDCAIYNEDMEGVHILFKKGDSLVEGYVAYATMDLSARATVRMVATGGMEADSVVCM